METIQEKPKEFIIRFLAQNLRMKQKIVELIRRAGIVWRFDYKIDEVR